MDTYGIFLQFFSLTSQGMQSYTRTENFTEMLEGEKADLEEILVEDGLYSEIEIYENKLLIQ